MAGLPTRPPKDTKAPSSSRCEATNDRKYATHVWVLGALLHFGVHALEVLAAVAAGKLVGTSTQISDDDLRAPQLETPSLQGRGATISAGAEPNDRALNQGAFAVAKQTMQRRGWRKTGRGHKEKAMQKVGASHALVDELQCVWPNPVLTRATRFGRKELRSNVPHGVLDGREK